MKKFLFILFYLNSIAQPAGSLDSSYGNNGIFQDCNNTSFSPFGLKKQSDGKVLYNGRFNTLRINQNGILDTTFGTNGFLNWFNITGIGSDPVNIEIQNDDKILLYSRKSNGSAWISTIVRFLPNGQIDTTFGVNGINELSIIQNLYPGESIKQLTNGKILLAGNTSGSYNQFTIVQLNSNGSLDTSFGINGIAEIQFNLTTTEQQGTCLAIQPDGKIIVGGIIATNGIGQRIAFIKLDSNGTLDSSFGTNGKTILNYGNYDIVSKIYLQNDGSIIATGEVNTLIPISLKLSSNGMLDTSYGINGFSETPVYYGSSGFSAQQVDGKILLPISSDQAKIFRLNTNGMIDTSFGNNGYYFNTTIGDNGSGANSITIQSDNKILVGTTNPNSDLSGLCSVVLRLNPGVLSNQVFSKAVNLFPNPTTDFVYFDNATLNFDSIAVYNTIGQELNSMPLSFSNNEKISLSAYSKGVYFLKFNDGNKSATVKVIKE